MDNALRARSLRRDSTDAERAFWNQVRAKRLGGHRFRRQVPIGPYIVDFVCPTARLVVELDGGHHQGQAFADERRTQWLEGEGYRVLRGLEQRCAGKHDRSVDSSLGGTERSFRVDVRVQVRRPDPLSLQGERVRERVLLVERGVWVTWGVGGVCGYTASLQGEEYAASADRSRERRIRRVLRGAWVGVRNAPPPRSTLTPALSPCRERGLPPPNL